MPTIAPRFNPEGVRVGSMPVPDVKPAMGTANALASIGETIANLGQTVDRVQDNQARRYAYEAAKLKAQSEADQTAGNSLFLDWEAQQDQKSAEYRTLNGRDAIGKFQDYTKATAQSVDGFTEGKDASAGAIAAFKQKANRKLRNYGAQAHTHVQNENTKYVVATEGRVMESSINEAAFALAGGKQEDAALAFHDAMVSADRISGVTGIPADAQSIANKAYYGAMERLDKADRPDETLRFYNANKDKFGNRSADAEALANHSADKVYVGTMTAVADQQGRDKNGNFDPDMAAKAARSASDKIQDPMLKGNPSRDKLLETSLKDLAAKDTARRSAIGDEVHQVITQKFTEPFGAAKAKAWMDTPYIQKTVIARMNDTDYARLQERIAGGPTHNNSVDMVRLEAMLSDGDVPPEQVQKAMPGMVLSNEKRAYYANALQKREENRGKAEWDAVETLWKIQEKADPKLRKVAYNDKMGDDEAARLIETNKAFTQIVNGMVKEKRQLSFKELQDAYNSYATTGDIADGGDKTTKRVMDITRDDAAGITDQQVAKAKALLPPSAPDGAVYQKAAQIHQDWLTKIAKAEAASEGTDSMGSIMQDAKTATTFADIDAVRARYGAFSRRQAGATGDTTVAFDVPQFEWGEKAQRLLKQK